MGVNSTALVRNVINNAIPSSLTRIDVNIPRRQSTAQTGLLTPKDQRPAGYQPENC